MLLRPAIQALVPMPSVHPPTHPSRAVGGGFQAWAASQDPVSRVHDQHCRISLTWDDRHRLSKIPGDQVALASFQTCQGLCPTTDADDTAHLGIGPTNLQRRQLERVFSAGDDAALCCGPLLLHPATGTDTAFCDYEHRWTALRAVRLFQRQRTQGSKRLTLLPRPSSFCLHYFCFLVPPWPLGQHLGPAPSARTLRLRADPPAIPALGPLCTRHCPQRGAANAIVTATWYEVARSSHTGFGRPLSFATAQQCLHRGHP